MQNSWSYIQLLLGDQNPRKCHGFELPIQKPIPSRHILPGQAWTLLGFKYLHIKGNPPTKNYTVYQKKQMDTRKKKTPFGKPSFFRFHVSFAVCETWPTSMPSWLLCSTTKSFIQQLPSPIAPRSPAVPNSKRRPSSFRSFATSPASCIPTGFAPQPKPGFHSFLGSKSYT